MRVFTYFFKQYINTNIHVSIAVTSLFHLVSSYFKIAVPTNAFFIVFFSSMLSYNGIKFFESCLTNNYRINYKNLLFLLVYFIVFLYFFIELTSKSQIVILIGAILTSFYIIPFFRKKTIRNFYIIKISWVAITWAWLSVVFVWSISNQSFSLEWVVIFIQLFLLVWVIILPFEIRDTLTDATDLQTISQRIGIKRTKRIGYILIIIFFSLSFILKNLSELFIPNLIITILILFILKKSTLKQSTYYSSFWVESIPIVWWGLNYTI